MTQYCGCLEDVSGNTARYCPQYNGVTLCILKIMAIRVVEFSNGDTKLERFLPKNQHTQRKLLNFEFWINGELSKSAKI